MILVGSSQLKILYSNCFITLERDPILPETGNRVIPPAKAKKLFFFFFGCKDFGSKHSGKHMQMIVTVGDARLSYAVRFIFCTVPKKLASRLSTSLRDGSSMTILFYKQKPGIISRNTPTLNAHMLPFE